MFRKRMNKWKSKKIFSRTASRVHKKNARTGGYMFRGGIRA